MTYQELYQYAIFLLSRRDYSTSELQRRIERRIRETERIHRLPPECLPQVIERLLKASILMTIELFIVFRSYLNKSMGSYVFAKNYA